MPFTFWLARLCEEFPCYGPEEAYRAWLTAPAGMFEEILEARAFARAKQMTDDADTPAARDRLPQTPLFALVQEIEFERVRDAGGKATQTDGSATDDHG